MGAHGSSQGLGSCGVWILRGYSMDALAAGIRSYQSLALSVRCTYVRSRPCTGSDQFGSSGAPEFSWESEPGQRFSSKVIPYSPLKGRSSRTAESGSARKGVSDQQDGSSLRRLEVIGPTANLNDEPAHDRDAQDFPRLALSHRIG